MSFSPCNSPEHHYTYMVMGKLQALVYDTKKVLESDARSGGDGKSPESPYPLPTPAITSPPVVERVKCCAFCTIMVAS